MKLLTLSLQAETPRPAKLSFWPFIDLGVIALFVLLLGSKFIVAPGLTIALPELENTQVPIAAEYEVLTVSEIDGEEMILFQGRILSLVSFQKLLEKRGPLPGDRTLLVRSDALVSIQTLSRLAEIASLAGYRRIQLATEEKDPKSSSFDFRPSY